MSAPLCTCGHPKDEHEEVGARKLRGACCWAWNELPPPATGCPCACFVPASEASCECGHTQADHAAGYAWCAEQCPCMLFRPAGGAS